ncbi:IS630 transposase-related protein [Thermostichus sp. MS-CIW-28]
MRQHECGSYVTCATVYRWLSRADLTTTKVKTRKRKTDLAALQQDVDRCPEARLKDGAQRQSNTH